MHRPPEILSNRGGRPSVNVAEHSARLHLPARQRGDVPGSALPKEGIQAMTTPDLLDEVARAIRDALNQEGWEGVTDCEYEVMARALRQVVENEVEKRMGWRPIGSLEDGEHVLLYFQHGERGVGGIESGTVFRYDDQWSYWTHGGPNSGLDWYPRDNENPTHWMPLPTAPASEPSQEQG